MYREIKNSVGKIVSTAMSNKKGASLPALLSDQEDGRDLAEVRKLDSLPFLNGVGMDVMGREAFAPLGSSMASMSFDPI